MKPIPLLFLNVSSEQASDWTKFGKAQNILESIHFIQKRKDVDQWEESVTIDDHCRSFYDLKLFLTNCRRSRIREGRMVGLIDHPPFFSLNEDFTLKEGGNRYKDGYRESGITYRCHGHPSSLHYYPQASFENPQFFLKQRPALFLDRDGIVNVDKGYVYRQEDIELCPGIGSLVETAKKKKWWVCVLSNQSGVARGLYSRDQVESLHNFLGSVLPVDGWLFCPYHPEGKGEYQGFSHLRKPAPGMALQAERIFPIDRLNSLMIGDRESDRIHLQGLKNALVQGDYKLDSGKGDIFSNLDEIRERL